MHWTHYVLIAVCAFAYWQRVPAITRVATVFLCNAAFLTGWAWFVNPTIDPLVQFIVDLVSARIIMKDPAGLEQGWIGLIFAFRIGSTWAFFRAGAPESAAYDYWHFMNMTAQVMMFVLLVWSEMNGGQISRLIGRLYRAIFRGFTRHSANQ